VRGFRQAQVPAVLLVLSGPIWAATIVMDQATCTLVDTITAANTDAAVGRCAAGAGPDTIELMTDIVLTEADNCGDPAVGCTGLPIVESDDV